jgi:hypothetical protein
VLRVIKAFDAAGISYMLVGSYSSNYYGRPRSTKDADFVVQVDHDALITAIQGLRPDFAIDRQMSFESVTLTTRYILNHPATAFKVELFLLGNDPHDIERFNHRRQVDFEGTPAWLPSVEDVVITKLRWAARARRSKDRDDVFEVLSVSSDTLDLAYIRKWANLHGTRDLFEQLLIESTA